DGIEVSDADTSEIETKRSAHTVSYDVDIYWVKNGEDGEDYEWYASISQSAPSKGITPEGDKYVFVKFEKQAIGRYKVTSYQELEGPGPYHLGDNLVDETHGIAVFVQSVSTSPGKTIETSGQEILGAEVVMPLDTFDYIPK
ncbi:MAG: hypothetical protein J7J14_06930, partial [Thermotogaceae bacterium]|nr:hypothetical protein [Thermotogaceae bacterium]